MTIAPPLPRLDEAAREAEWLELSDNIPTLQPPPSSPILPSSVVDALFSEGRACADNDRKRGIHQWKIGGIVHEAAKINTHAMEEFWEACLDILSESDAGWTYSLTSIKRWARAYERLHNVIDIDKYLARLPFETVCVSGELAAAGLCNAEEALALAVTNGLTAEQLRDAYETGGHAPVWKQMSRAWGKFFERVQNTPIWEEAKPHVEEIRKIIERGEK